MHGMTHPVGPDVAYGAGHRLRGHWYCEWRARDPAPRLPVRPASLRRGGAAAGRRRLPRAGAVPARLRPHPLSQCRDAPFGATGRPGQRPAQLHGCARPWPGRRSSATTGAAGPRASWRRSGQTASAAWCPPAGTTFSTSARPRIQLTPSRSIGSGTSTTSTPSAAAPASPSIEPSCAACCGACGRQPGTFPPLRTTAPPPRSTILISWTWSSTRTATGLATPPVIRPTPTSRRSWPNSP